MKRFNEARLQSKNFSSNIILAVLFNSICHTHLRLSIWKNKPIFLDVFPAHIDKYIDQEESETVLNIVTFKGPKKLPTKEEVNEDGAH